MNKKQYKRFFYKKAGLTLKLQFSLDDDEDDNDEDDNGDGDGDDDDDDYCLDGNEEETDIRDLCEEHNVVVDNDSQTEGESSSPLIPDEKLVKISTRELNMVLKGCNAEVVKEFRKRRRLLKNRVYAQRHRSKHASKEFYHMMENSVLKEKLLQKLKEKAMYKNKYHTLLEMLNEVMKKQPQL